MELYVIDIEQISAERFVLTLNDSSQREIDLKVVLEKIDGGKWEGKKGFGLCLGDAKEDSINAFHLNECGELHWSFGDYNLSSCELIDCSTEIQPADVTNIPNILSQLCCLDLMDVLERLGMTIEDYELWKLDPHADKKTVVLMMLALNSSGTFYNMDRIYPLK